MSESKDTQNIVTPEGILDQLNSSLAELQVDYLKKRLDDEMKNYPGLSEFVKRKMTEALNKSEQILISSTSLITFQYCLANVVPDQQAIQELSTEKHDISTLPLLAIVMEDDDLFLPKDNNRVFVLLQEKMEKHPDLASFIANKMKASVSLEEANIVGRTTIVVYEIMSFPFSKNEK